MQQHSGIPKSGDRRKPSPWVVYSKRGCTRPASSVSYADTFPNGGRLIKAFLLGNQEFLCTKLEFNIVTIRTNILSVIKKRGNLKPSPVGEGVSVADG